MLPAFLINQIVVIIITSLGVILGGMVYWKNRSGTVNRLFALMTFSILIWVNAAFLGSMFFTDRFLSILSVKINWAATAFFIIFAYFFSIYFPKTKRRPSLEIITVIIWIAVAIVSLFTDFIIKDVEINKFGEWGNNLVYGPLGDLYLTLSAAWAVLILFNLFRKYITLSKEDKLKAQYFILAMSLMAFFNIIFNVIFPFVRGDTQYYQFGDYSSLFLFLFMGIAILKRKLFEVKVILVDILIIAIGIFFLILILLLEGMFLKALGWSAFVLFCFFSYLLVKYTHREINQREVLEGKVQERTKELEKSKNVAEERAREIEKWYRLTVGRELRMAELKEKIKEMEGERQK